jgi:hypothetical protein
LSRQSGLNVHAVRKPLCSESMFTFCSGRVAKCKPLRLRTCVGISRIGVQSGGVHAGAVVLTEARGVAFTHGVLKIL